MADETLTVAELDRLLTDNPMALGARPTTKAFYVEMFHRLGVEHVEIVDATKAPWCVFVAWVGGPSLNEVNQILPRWKCAHSHWVCVRFPGRDETGG